MVRSQHLADALERGEVSWADVDRVRRAGRGHPAGASTPSCRRPAPPVDVLGSPEHRALAREVAARSVVLLRNEPSTGDRSCPSPPPSGWRCSAGWPTRSTSVTVGRATCGTWSAGRSSTASAPRSPTSSTTTAPTWPGPPRSRRRPMSPWSWWATRTSTRASSSATSPRCSAASSRRPTSPRWSSGSRPWPRDLPTITKPQHLVERPRGFSLGGDRIVAAPAGRRCRPGPGRGRRQPAHGRGHPGRQRRGGHRVVRRRARRRAGLVRRQPGRTRSGRRAARRGQPVGPSALQRARRRGRPPRLRQGRHAVPLRPLARLVAPRPLRDRRGVPLRVRPVVHDLRAGRGRRDARPTVW